MPYKDNNNKGNKKAKVIFWDCNKSSHKKRDRTIWRRKHGLNNPKAKTKDTFVAMIFDQINVVQNDNDWWLIWVPPSMCAKSAPSSGLLYQPRIDKCSIWATPQLLMLKE